MEKSSAQKWALVGGAIAFWLLLILLLGASNVRAGLRLSVLVLLILGIAAALGNKVLAGLRSLAGHSQPAASATNGDVPETLITESDTIGSDVREFGSAMGREAVQNGIALGRTLLCPDPLRKPMMEDGSELSKQTRAAGIAYATYLAMAATDLLNAESNRQAFLAGVGNGVRAELQRLNSIETIGLVFKYVDLPITAGLTKRSLLNIQKPGTNDILAVLLDEVATQNQKVSIAFRQTGILGFDVIAIPLVEETGMRVLEAAKKHGW